MSTTRIIPLITIIISLVILPSKYVASLPTGTSNVTLFEQRALYPQAISAFNNGNSLQYQQLTESLSDYPLYPYLKFLSLSTSLDRLPYYEVDQFLEKNKNTYIEEKLLREWLQLLAEKRHWHDFRTYYTHRVNSTELACDNIWAGLKTGDRSALKHVAPLWDVKHSQPNACDRVFSEWRKQGELTSPRLWSRYKKVVHHRNAKLGQYILSLVPTSERNAFNTYRNVHQNPSLLNTTQNFKTKTTRGSDIVQNGLQRLQRKNPEEAFSLFQEYNQFFNFSDDFKEIFIAKNRGHYVRNIELSESNNLIGAVIGDHHDSLDTILLKAVRAQKWEFYIQWFDKLPAQEKQKDQWTYWYARANEILFSERDDVYNNYYQSLAKKRSFYGFLAADRLKIPYELQDKPLTIDDSLLLEINHIPAIARARELFLQQDIMSARQEWRRGVEGLSAQAVQASAKLANEWGWHRKAIEMLGKIKAWDHLSVRFPIIHENIIQEKALEFNYPSSLIFAITRQESAWQKDATSHAGARGLMQLIPSTAKDAARKAGIKHTTAYLYKPEHNIALGSFHVNELLEKYDNNRLLAIAAYNAGQRRVNQWTKASNGELPYDVWIENIPFKETRNYVKNVLFYSALYDYRSGNKMSLLTVSERETKL